MTEQPLNVLFVTVGLDPRMGGPPRVVAGLGAALAHKGHRVTVATLRAPGAPDVTGVWPELAAAGVDVRIFPLDRPYQVGASRAFNRFVDRVIAEFDVVHLHSLWSQCLNRAAAAARRSGVPYVLSPHGALDRVARRMARWKKAISLALGTRSLLRGASVIQFGTADEAEEAADLGLSADVVVIPNGVDVPREGGAGQGMPLEAFPDLAGEGPIFLSLARIHEKKGLDVLLEAFAGLRQDSSARLLIAGIPEDRTLERRLRRRIEEPDLAGRAVLTTEYIGQAAASLLDAADVFVHPALQEGFSMAILEALASGTPVVISDRCHLPEVESEGAGFVVPASRDGLLEALMKIDSMSRAELRGMGESGRTWVVREFSWDGVGRRTVEVYRRLKQATESEF